MILTRCSRGRGARVGRSAARRRSRSARAKTHPPTPADPLPRLGQTLMCGIYGLVSAPGVEPVSTILARMTARLVHRGPDGDGVMRPGRAALGCRRLAIIDVAGG